MSGLDHGDTMQYTYGADETQPAGPFIRVIAPTDIQQVAEQMARVLKDSYPGIDLLNTRLWHLIGAFVYSGPIVEWLQRVIALEREWRASLNESSADRFKNELRSRHGYTVDDVVDYNRAYLQVMREGLVPDSIRVPWTYQPETVAADIGKGAADVMKSVWPYLLGAVAVYAAVSAFAPNLIAGLMHGRR